MLQALCDADVGAAVHVGVYWDDLTRDADVQGSIPRGMKNVDSWKLHVDLFEWDKFINHEFTKRVHKPFPNTRAETARISFGGRWRRPDWWGPMVQSE